MKLKSLAIAAIAVSSVAFAPTAAAKSKTFPLTLITESEEFKAIEGGINISFGTVGESGVLIQSNRRSKKGKTPLEEACRKAGLSSVIAIANTAAGQGKKSVRIQSSHLTTPNPSTEFACDYNFVLAKTPFKARAN